MSEGVIGLGTLLKIGDGASPEVFTAIAEVKDINGPAPTREFAEFTHEQSSGGNREYKPTFKNSGDVTSMPTTWGSWDALRARQGALPFLLRATTRKRRHSCCGSSTSSGSTASMPGDWMIPGDNSPALRCTPRTSMLPAFAERCPRRGESAHRSGGPQAESAHEKQPGYSLYRDFHTAADLSATDQGSQLKCLATPFL